MDVYNMKSTKTTEQKTITIRENVERMVNIYIKRAYHVPRKIETEQAPLKLVLGL